MESVRHTYLECSDAFREKFWVDSSRDPIDATTRRSSDEDNDIKVALAERLTQSVKYNYQDGHHNG